MSDMLERVARAIDPVAWSWIDAIEKTDPQHAALQMTKARVIGQAQAAIAAMREPTDAMIDLGDCESLGEQLSADRYERPGPHEFELIWQAMIDEALRERADQATCPGT